MGNNQDQKKELEKQFVRQSARAFLFGVFFIIASMISCVAAIVLGKYTTFFGAGLQALAGIILICNNWKDVRKLWERE